jgi:hypothetical protein
MEKSWVWWGTPVIPATVKNMKKEDVVQACLGKKQDPVSKITRVKGAEGTPAQKTHF